MEPPFETPASRAPQDEGVEFVAPGLAVTSLFHVCNCQGGRDKFHALVMERRSRRDARGAARSPSARGRRPALQPRPGGKDSLPDCQTAGLIARSDFGLSKYHSQDFCFPQSFSFGAARGDHLAAESGGRRIAAVAKAARPAANALKFRGVLAGAVADGAAALEPSGAQNAPTPRNRPVTVRRYSAALRCGAAWSSA